ncbi:hypothetical protein G7Y89_g14786 [Cudoniella acicularis]|uniref:Eukaryotic translation initiation factor 3 subunit G n=1 Tax=Cudoniella acicularis TaxID=354080 RepID=A0A8H4VR66_9HELO|nr:hypothetical protein G7Y89_g14786 [Cudoniella acicularis]
MILSRDVGLGTSEGRTFRHGLRIRNYRIPKRSPHQTSARPDWADDVEGEDIIDELPAQSTTTNKDGTKTIVTWRFNDDGKKVKTTRRIRFTTHKEIVNPRVAERKHWSKFGLSAKDGAGPAADTTSVGENIIFRPSINWRKDAKEEKPDASSMKEQLKNKKVKCRICNGEHFTARCPFKDTMAPVGEEGSADPAAGPADAPEAAGGLGSGKSSYVPPHMRNGGSAALVIEWEAASMREMIWQLFGSQTHLEDSKPPQDYWKITQDPQPNCVNQISSLLVAGIVNTLTDLIVVLLPIRLFWSLQIPTKEVLPLVLLFAFGFASCCAGIVRTYFTYQVFMTWDSVWASYPLWLSAACELYIGIICASIPATKPFFSSYLPQLFGSTPSTFANTEESFSRSYQLSKSGQRTIIVKNERLDSAGGDEELLEFDKRMGKASSSTTVFGREVRDIEKDGILEM